MLKTIVCLVLTFSFLNNLHAAAEQWLCTEEASQIQNGSLLACGVGIGKDENEARTVAFENAKAEFKRVCNSSDTCKNHEVSVEPRRTSCEQFENSYKCYRLIVFTIGIDAASHSEVSSNQESKKLQLAKRKVKVEAYTDTKEVFEPFVYESIAALPKLYKGMPKKKLLSSFGAPKSVTDSGSYGGIQRLQMFFDGDMCEYGSCYVIVEGGKVDNWTSFKPIYTDYLK